MGFDNELLDSLVALGQTAERVRENRACSADPDAINKSMSFKIRAQDVLEFEGGHEDIEVERLVRIIANASASAERVATFIRTMGNSELKADEAIPHSAVQRYAATLRDSLGTLSYLMGGWQYVRKTPEWTEVAGAESELSDDKSEMGLQGAFIYQRLKTLRAKSLADHITKTEVITFIDGLLKEIREGK